MGDYVVDPTISSNTSMESTTTCSSCMDGIDTHETTGSEISSTVQDATNTDIDEKGDSTIILKAGMVTIHLGSRNLPRPSSVVYLALPVHLGH